jgi:hypothetical protein
MTYINSFSSLAEFFSTPEKPLFLGTGEFADFWNSLTSEEQYYYKTVDLSQETSSNE